MLNLSVIMAAIKLLRCKVAADRAGLKPASLRQLDRDGILHPIRDWAGHRRFREDEIDDFRKKLLSGEIGEAVTK